MIAYEENGEVKVIHPAPGKTDEDCLKNVPEGAQYKIITEVPGRRFRGSWKLAGDKVEVDLPSAREAVLDEVRQDRDARLTETDKEKVRLDEIGTPEQRHKLAVYRQSLRDLPAVVGTEIMNKTLAELEAYVPQWPGYVP